MPKDENITTDEKQKEIQFPVSLRDYFAGQALSGLLAKQTQGKFSGKDGINNASKYSYEYADAMLEARKRESEGI